MKTNVILFIFALCSVGLVFFVKAQHPKTSQNISMETKPQEYMTQVFVSAFTDTGALKYELSAETWAYLPRMQQSTLKIPHLTIYKPDGAIWKVKAKTGKIKQSSLSNLEEIALEKKVVLERLVTQDLTALALETESLSYQPKKNYAESAEWVTLTKPGLKITGLGLHAFLDKNSLDLLQHVKSYYTP